MVKGLEEDELETTDLVKKNVSDEPNHVKTKWTRRKPKTMPRWKSRYIEGCGSSILSSIQASNQVCLVYGIRIYAELVAYAYENRREESHLCVVHIYI